MSSLLRAGAIYALANVLAAGVPFMLLPVLTRVLSPAEYGRVVSFFMLVPVCAAVAGLSVHGAVGVRWLDRRSGDPRSYTAAAVLVAFGSSAVAAALAAVFAPRAGIELAPALCALAAVVAGATALQGTRFAVWQAAGQALPAATLQVSSAAFNVGLSLLAVLALQAGGTGRILGASVAVAAVAALSVFSLHRDACLARPTAADIRSVLRFGLPLVPHTLAGAVLASVDRFAVAGQLGSGPLGVYGAASQLGLIINVITDAATKAYTPTMYRLLAAPGLRSRLRLVGVAYLSVPVWAALAVVVWLLLGALGGWVLGPKYQEAISLSWWFLLGGAIGGIYLQVAGLFFFSGRTEWLGAATMLACAFSAVLAPWAVAAYGASGGAMAYCAAQAALVLAAWGLSQRLMPMPWVAPRLAVRVLIGRRAGRSGRP
ncbi:MAG: lipopolysaccharide biosynthesis protein [Burkholderiales bacterium]|nr:lipopolysaccharide biosynthesis protein [Burkholderiales bacterium]